MSRALAFVLAVLVLTVSLSAEAKKKKKASKKHKTPAAKTTSKSKATKSKESDRGLPPPESAPETDEATKEPGAAGQAGKEEKVPPSKSAAEPGEGEEKAAKAPPAAEPEEGAPGKPAPKAKPSHVTAEPEGGGTLGSPIALSLGVGGKALFRNLSWTEAMGALAPYSLSPGPEGAVWVEAFPAAFASDGFAGNIGIYGHFDYGLGASSKTPPPASQTLTTKFYDFLVGLKVRFPLGMFLPYVTGAYGMQKFSLEPLDMSRPNFNYSFASGGAGARVQIMPALDLDLGAAYLYVLNPGSGNGDVASKALYPNATGYGVDVSLSIGYRLFSVVGLRAGGDFRQFGVTTHWKTGDTAPRAGGAADRNISVWGGVEIVFDGMGAAAGGGEGEEAAPAKKAAPAKGKKPPPREVEPEEGGGAGAGDGGGPGAGPGAGTDTDE